MASSLHDAIRSAGGEIPFREFMQLALYGNEGFYTRRGEAGRRGDFITSPEVGPLFAAVLARALDAWWKEMGSPSSFTVMEVGAGPGTLARGLLAAQPECSKVWTYIAVEVSDAQRAKHPSEVTSLAEIQRENSLVLLLPMNCSTTLPLICVYSTTNGVNLGLD